MSSSNGFHDNLIFYITSVLEKLRTTTLCQLIKNKYIYKHRHSKILCMVSLEVRMLEYNALQWTEYKNRSPDTWVPRKQ